MSDTTISPENTEEAPNERRALLRKIAIGGAGAAAGAVLLNHGTASAAPANLQTEQTNATVAPTIVDFTPGTPPTKVGPSAFSAGGYVPAADSPYAAGVGGYGDATILNGVHGSTTAPDGFGVVAANLAPAAASASAAVPTAQAITSPDGVHMLLLAGKNSGTLPAGKHVAGELYVDKDGTLWFSVPTATAGVVRFVKLAGTPAAGAFHAIDPQRSYDSRQAAYTVKGPLAPNTNRVISVADGHATDGGAVTLKDVVPDKATAVQINVTAANMTAPNFLSVTAGDKTSTNTSLLNWSPGDVQIANSITVPLDASRQIKVFCGNQTGSTDVIIDVFGYYL